MPGYGVRGRASKRTAWSKQRARIVSARSYWIVTARRDGTPHAVPAWGVWMDGELIFDSGRESRKTRDLLVNPEAVIHLDGGEDALILHGRVTRLRDRSLARRFARAYERKYDWDYDAEDPPGLIFRFRPRVAIAFTEELIDSATRWRF